MSEWSTVGEGDVEARERRGGGPSSRDIAGALGAESMAVRIWTYGPGHEMTYHHHRAQEELYRLMSGGPQEVLVEGVGVVVVEDGEWLRFAPDTARRIQNLTDREAVWMAVAAPVGAGVRDGVPVDSATGMDIPRPA